MIDVAKAACRTGASIIHLVQVCFLQLAVLMPGAMLVAGLDDAYAQAAEGVTSKTTAKAVARNDLVVDRGAGGLWVLLNRTTWQRIDTGNATGVAVGDINGDGKDDIIYGMNRTGRVGTFVRLGGASLASRALIVLDVRPARLLAVGDTDNDGNGKANIFATFQGTPGTFMWNNNHPAPLGNSDFFMVHESTARAIALGDLQGDNVLDVIIALPTGIFVCFDAQAPWIPIGPDDAFPPGFQNVVVGDFNNDGQDDLLGDRAANGVWRSTDGGNTWTRINNRNPTVLDTGDPEGNLRDGAFASFPDPNGGLFYSPNAVANPPWTRLSPKIPTAIEVGRFDAGAKEEIFIVDPTNPNVIYHRRNNTGAFNPLTMPPGNGPVDRMFLAGLD